MKFSMTLVATAIVLTACGGGGQQTAQSQVDAIDAQIASGAMAIAQQTAAASAKAVLAAVAASPKKTAQMDTSCGGFDCGGDSGDGAGSGGGGGGGGGGTGGTGGGGGGGSGGGGGLGGNPSGATSGYGMSNRVPTTTYDYNFLLYGGNYGCMWGGSYVCCIGMSCSNQ